MSTTLNGSTGITFPDGSIQNTVSLPGMRNRIINGAMMIDQRASGASWTPTSPTVRSYGSCDRWGIYNTAASKLTAQQSSTAPTGFSNSMVITSTTALSVAASDLYIFQQVIEGTNVADLAWGTASAQPVTVSFWVRSSLTGSFGFSIYTSANRSYPILYTISSANTWEYKTITIPGDTGAAISTTNTASLYLSWQLAVGSNSTGTSGSWNAAGPFGVTGATNILATNGATFYITGVQLERGITATSFDYRPYGTELALCQRYFYQTTSALGLSLSATNLYASAIRFPVTMRTAPTLVNASFAVNSGNAGTPTTQNVAGSPATGDALYIYNSAANWTVSVPVALTSGFNSEL